MGRTGTLSIDRVTYAAVAAFVLVVTWNGFPVSGGAIANALLAVAAAGVAGQAIGGRSIPVPPWLLAAGAGFVAAAMLNVIVPPDSALLTHALFEYRTIPQVEPPVFFTARSDLLALAKLLLVLVMIPIIIASVATTEDRIERLIDALVISAVLNAAVGVLDVAGMNITATEWGNGRTAGLTIHPNYLALTCTIGIPLALLWVARGGRWKPPGYVCTALLLTGAYASGSRIGAVTAVLAIVLTVLLIPRLRFGLGMVLPVAGMAILALAFFAGAEIIEQVRLSGDVGTQISITGSNSQRSQLAELALQQFEARPLQGVGMGFIQDAHSIYLQLLAAGGVIALASFLVFLGGLWGALLRALAGPQRETATAVGVAISMWLLNGVVDNQLADKYLYVAPGLLLAIACVARTAAPATARPATAGAGFPVTASAAGGG